MTPHLSWWASFWLAFIGGATPGIIWGIIWFWPLGGWTRHFKRQRGTR